MTAEPSDEVDAELVLDGVEQDLDQLAEAWVFWSHRHRLYEPTSAGVAALSRRGVLTRPMLKSADPTISAARIAAFHIAYTCQPDALDKQVFALYYVARVRPVKVAAAALGIGRAQFYRVLEAFRRRVAAAAQALEGTSANAYSLRVLSKHTGSGDVNGKSVSS
jgi:hypothetical protein